MSDRPPMAFGYCRVTKGYENDPKREKITLPLQREGITNYYQLALQPRGVEWGDFFTDNAVSGRVPIINRAEGCKLLYAVERDDHIVIYKLDRAFRRFADAAATIDRWGEQGVNFHLLDLNIDSSTAAGRMIVQLMAAFAEFERARTSERTKESAHYRKLKGLPVGRPPYGFVCRGPHGNKKLVPDEYKRSIGKQIVKWKLTGFSWEDIYFHLLNHKVENRHGRVKGREWSIGAIRRAFVGECQLQAQEEAVKQGAKPAKKNPR